MSFNRYLQYNKPVLINDLSLNNTNITDVATPINSNDGVNKNYVDSIIAPFGSVGELIIFPNYGVPLTINITVLDQWENILPFGDVHSLNTTVDGVNGTITILYPGFYLLSASISARSAGNDILEFGFGINGLDPLSEHIFGGSDSSGSRFVQMGFTALHNFSLNDVINFQCRNKSDTDNIDIAVCHFNLVKVSY